MSESINSLNLMLFSSKRTELLIDILADNIRLDSPFARTSVIVPNSGMQRYLQLELSKRHSILAHVNIMYLGEFLNKRALSDKSPPIISFPDQRALAFAIDSVISELREQKKLPEKSLKHLESFHTAQHQFSWASTFANILLGYARQRQHWLKAWEADNLISDFEDESWQKYLFQILLNIFPSLISNESVQERNLTESKEPIHVFGFHAIAESQRQLLWSESKDRPVFFYCLNPSTEYWLQLSKPTQSLRASLDHPDDELHHDIGNPLLANWGLAGKFLLQSLLNDADWQSLNLDDDQTSEVEPTNVSNLQKSIDNLDDKTPKTNAHDDSITLHACANARREIDVLFDWICQELDNNDSLTLSDFLVMMPNIGDYASHIHAVFGQSPLSHYSVAHQSEAATQPDVSAFLSILSVISSHYSVVSLFNLCAQPSIMQAFDISFRDLAIMRKWFSDANLNWGLNTDKKSEFSNDDALANQGSLEKLIDELNLAHLFGEQSIPEISPDYQEVQLDSLIKLNQLFHLFSQFIGLEDENNHLDDWFRRLNELIQAYCLDGSGILSSRIQDWYEVVKDASQKSYHFEIIYLDIKEYFEKSELHGPFLSGGITFCSLQPMRAIPARRLCLLGMNQDFPMPHVQQDYDLRKKLPEPYDVLHHEEQKYFMLESILSAREKLYLSYQGIDDKNAKKCPPSPLVSEIQHFFNASDIVLPHREHALQRLFSDGEWQQYAHTTPSVNPGLSTMCPTSSLSSSHPPASNKHAEQLAKQPDLRQFSINDLTRYLISPLEAYFDHHSIRLSLPNKSLHEYEMLLPSHLDNYFLRKQVQLHPSQAESWLMQQNLAPASIFRSEVYEQINSSLSDFKKNFETIQSSLPEKTETVMPAYVEIENVRIHYNLDPLYDSTRFIWDVSTLKLKALVHAWLTAICANANGDTISTILLYRNYAIYHNIDGLTVEMAKNCLGEIIDTVKNCHTHAVQVEYKLKDSKKLSIAKLEPASLEQSLIPIDMRHQSFNSREAALYAYLNTIISEFSFLETYE